MIARLIGIQIDPESWREADLTDLEEQIEQTQAEIKFLRHHTWKQIYARHDLTVDATEREKLRKTIAAGGEDDGAGTDEDESPVSFADLVDVYAPTGLVGDLIAHGYLPRYFARYSSMFYGDVVGLSAAEYISRAIEPGEPIAEYELDSTAIEQILIEQEATGDDADLFDDLSIYNLDFLDYLLVHRPNAARRVAHHLATRWNDLEQGLVERYFQRGDINNAVTLASMMAPKWGKALRYATIDMTVAPETRLRLVDTILRNISDEAQEDLTDAVGNYLTDNYRELTAVTEPETIERASIVMAAFAAAGTTIPELGPLNNHALAAATVLSIYPVTSSNLAVLGGAEEVSLDRLSGKPASRPIYQHMLDNLGDYFEALRHLEPTGVPVRTPAAFADVLNDVASIAEGIHLDELLEDSQEECRIAELDVVAPEAWSKIVKHDRTDATFANVQRYVAEYQIDEVLGEFLTEHERIEVPEATPIQEKLSLATAILAARDGIASADTRVALVASLGTGTLPITNVASKDGDLVGRLLAKDLLADDPTTFAPERLSNWADLKAAIGASEGYAMFVDVTILPPKHLASALQAGGTSALVQLALVEKVSSLIEGATPAEATAIAEVLADRRDQLDLPRIEAMQVAGASNDSLVRLLAGQQDTITVANLRNFLVSMQGDYARLAQGGSGIVGFTDNGHHSSLLARLGGVTHTGAKIRTTAKHGTRLEADLKQAD